MTEPSWWAQRWIAALERMVDAERLRQGRWHARAGRVVQLVVSSGGAEARLEGGDATPRSVAIRLRELTASQWEQVLEEMAAWALFSAHLLNGHLPPEIEEVFETAGASLLPAPRRDATCRCTCSDSRHGPCKHIAAAWYVLGDRLDDDPFLLLTMRGRGRDQVLAGLRAHRRSAQTSRRHDSDTDPARWTDSTVALQAAARGNGLASAASLLSSETSVDTFWTAPDGTREFDPGESLADVADTPTEDAQAVKRLEVPPFWRSRLDFHEEMEKRYRAIAARAELCLGDSS